MLPNGIRHQARIAQSILGAIMFFQNQLSMIGNRQ